MFHELEDQNLSLIQNGQDMEENIDEIKSQANVSFGQFSMNSQNTIIKHF